VANTKSAKKKTRVIARRRARNVAVRTRVKTAVRKALEALSQGLEAAQEQARKAETIIDRAAAKGVMHRNKAARKKSRLAKKVNALAAK
jgi:small subunit ribosomal protein S20